MDEKCEYCNGRLGEFIHLNSFVYKCLNCKQNFAATSFDSVKEYLEGEYEVFITDEDLNSQTLIGKGKIETLISQIECETLPEKLLYLKKKY